MFYYRKTLIAVNYLYLKKISHFSNNPFFRTYFNMNIRQYSDTFLSGPYREGLSGHYFCYYLIAQM